MTVSQPHTAPLLEIPRCQFLVNFCICGTQNHRLYWWAHTDSHCCADDTQYFSVLPNTFSTSQTISDFHLLKSLHEWRATKINWIWTRQNLSTSLQNTPLHWTSLHFSYHIAHKAQRIHIKMWQFLTSEVAQVLVIPRLDYCYFSLKFFPHVSILFHWDSSGT